MNEKKLLKLKKFILDEPRRYNQAVWCAVGAERLVLEQNPPCGTVACLAGNACLMEGYKHVGHWSSQFALGGQKPGMASDIAKKILGLNESQAARLFDADAECWSERAAKAYRKAKSLAAKARAAAMAIDDLILEGRAKRQAR